MLPRMRQPLRLVLLPFLLALAVSPLDARVTHVETTLDPSYDIFAVP